VAAIIVILVQVLRRIIVPPGHAAFGEAIPLLLPKSLITKADEYRGFVKAAGGVLKALRRLPDYLTRGYLDGSGNSSRILPGHGLAVALSAGFFAVYLFIGVLHCGTAVVYVLILLTVLCWGLSGFAFFLDVFRVPVLMCLAIWLIVAAQSPNSDHYFNVSKPPSSSRGSNPRNILLLSAQGRRGALSSSCRRPVAVSNLQLGLLGCLVGLQNCFKRKAIAIWTNFCVPFG
jgi:hypothetical protein